MSWLLRHSCEKGLVFSREKSYRRAGWCAPDLEVPGGSGKGLQQDPGNTASSLSGEMRSEQGPAHGQTHGPALWTGQYPQRLGRKKRERQTDKENDELIRRSRVCSSNIQCCLALLAGADCKLKDVMFITHSKMELLDRTNNILTEVLLLESCCKGPLQNRLDAPYSRRFLYWGAWMYPEMFWQPTCEACTGDISLGTMNITSWQFISYPLHKVDSLEQREVLEEP